MRYSGRLSPDAKTIRCPPVVNSKISPPVSRMVSATNRLPAASKAMSDLTGWKPVLLMPKMPDAGEYHRHLSLVSGGNHFFVTNRAAWLNRAGCASFGRRD